MPRNKFRLCLILAVLAVVALLAVKPLLHRPATGVDWTNPLRAAAEGADRLVVRDLNFHGRGQQPDFEIRGADKVQSLLAAIDIDPAQSGFHCACAGEFWIHIYRGDTEVATLGYHHCRSLRWIRGSWEGDGLLTAASSEALPAWFRQHGCAYLHDLREFFAARDRERADEQQRFVDCFPEAVRPLLLEPGSRPLDRENNQAIGQKIAALMGDGEAVAVAVCEALGAQTMTWRITGDKESRALAAVQTVSGAQFLAAVRKLQDRPAALCGAARVFFSQGFHKTVPAARTECVTRLATAVFTHGLDDDKPALLRFLEQETDPAARALLRQVFRGEVGKEIDLAKAFGQEPGLRTGAALSLVLSGDTAIKPEIQELLPRVTAKTDVAALEVCLALLGDPTYIKAEHFRLQSYNIGLAGLKAIELYKGKHGMEALVKGGIHHPWGHVNDEAVRTFARITGRELSRGEIEDWWEVEHEGQKRPQPVLHLRDSKGQPMCVKYSPDGRYLAAGSNDSAARVWDARTGKLLHTLEGHGHTVMDVAFHPEGRRLTTASCDSTIKLWDLATGRELQTLLGHSNRVERLAYQPGGTLLASGSSDGSVRLWDAATGRIVRQFDGHTAGRGVDALVFRPDGLRIATSGTSVFLWNPADASIDRTLRVEQVWAMAYSPDGGYLVTAEVATNAVRCWHAATGAVRWTDNRHTGVVQAVAFSPDGKHVASTGWDKTIVVRDAATGAVLVSFKAHPDSIYALAYAPDGKHLATASEDKTIKVWDIAAIVLAARQAAAEPKPGQDQ